MKVEGTAEWYRVLSHRKSDFPWHTCIADRLCRTATGPFHNPHETCRLVGLPKACSLHHRFGIVREIFRDPGAPSRWALRGSGHIHQLPQQPRTGRHSIPFAFYSLLLVRSCKREFPVQGLSICPSNPRQLRAHPGSRYSSGPRLFVLFFNTTGLTVWKCFFLRWAGG